MVTSRKRSSAASVADAARIVAEAAQLVAEAERDRALDVLEQLFVQRAIDRNGFSWPGQQAAVREAVALLVEAGRNVKGER